MDAVETNVIDPIDPVDTDEPIEPGPVVTEETAVEENPVPVIRLHIDNELVQKIKDSFSRASIAEIGKINEPFVYNERLYVAIDGGTNIDATAVEVVTVEEWNNSRPVEPESLALPCEEVHSEDFNFNGLLVKHGEAECVLGDSIIFHFFAEEVTLGDVYKKFVSTPLPEERRLEMGEKMAVLKGEIKDLEDKKKDIAKDYTDRINSRDEQLSEVAQAYRFGEEDVEVDCQTKFLWSEGIKETIRKDTGEVIASYPISAEDRQQDLVSR